MEQTRVAIDALEGGDVELKGLDEEGDGLSPPAITHRKIALNLFINQANGLGGDVVLRRET